LRAAERAGVRTLVIRPGAEEAQVHGLNLLRGDGHGEVADLSRARTAEVLASTEGRRFVRSWRAANRAAERRRAPGAARPSRSLRAGR
ncbi:MAG: hypothetical protein ACK4V6_01365, partial [Microthrixaceae bacterium]